MKNEFRRLLSKPFSQNADLLIRIWLGCAMTYHGFPGIFNKQGVLEFSKFLTSLNVPLPVFSAYLSLGAELICGVLILLGLFTRFASFALLINFSIAVLVAHDGKILGEGELAFLYWLFSMSVFLKGVSPFSLDLYLFKRKGKNGG